MTKLGIGAAVLTAAALALTLSVAPAMAADKGAAKAPAAQAKKKAPKPPKKMIMNGISSGVLRVPEITLWECAGGPMGGCNPNGLVKHGTEVMRHEMVKARGHKWAHVKGEGIDGWVKKDFLKRPGT